jgi:hypothetical protein
MLTKKILIINTTFDKGGAAKIARHVFKYVSEDESFDTYFAYSMGPRVLRHSSLVLCLRGIYIILVRFIGIEGYVVISQLEINKFIKNRSLI